MRLKIYPESLKRGPKKPKKAYSGGALYEEGHFFDPFAALSRRASVEDDEDQMLLLATTRGDRSAWGQIYDRHAGDLLAVGMAVLKEKTEAEDILHAVFVEAWKAAAAYDPVRGSVRSWLMVRMRSRCRDRQKSASYSRRATLDMAPETNTGSIRENGLAAELAADATKVQQALRAMPEELQSVLILGYFGGLSASEMALKLGVPQGTVKSRLATGLRGLRKRVGVPAVQTGKAGMEAQRDAAPGDRLRRESHAAERERR